MSFIIKHLSLVQVNNLWETKKSLNSFKLKFAEDRVVILQTQMTHVHLHFLVHCADLVAKLLSDLEEAFLYFLFDARVQLFLHVLYLERLALELFERFVAFTLIVAFGRLNLVLIDWSLGVDTAWLVRKLLVDLRQATVLLRCLLLLYFRVRVTAIPFLLGLFDALSLFTIKLG